jgi:multidrug efflux pump subunit AcrB
LGLFFVFLIIVGGISSLNSLGRLEDPEFTIKDAKVVTNYHGATPLEVEKEVTDILETAIQELKQLKELESKSEAGRSTITVTIQDKYDKDTLPQVWDELRRKVNDAQEHLPPGAGPSIVIDDFGDVFGTYLAITGEGYSFAELRDIVDDLRRDLLLIDQVAKVVMGGIQEEVIYVEIPRSKLAELGMSRKSIENAIVSQNLVTDAGRVEVGAEFIRIATSGTFESIEDIGNVVLQQPTQDALIRLSDISTIKRGYRDPPPIMIRHNGKPAITLGISIVSGGNIVVMGEAVKKRLAELESSIPAGIEIDSIYFQSDRVTESVNGFMINLAEAVGIVIFVLLLFMGLRSGLIIGSMLLLTILATFVVMKLQGVSLERISLGALIIALGMLVDNAIVVTDGILVKIEQGVDRIKAANDTVKQTMWPLFGATFVAIAAFAAIGLSQDKTGEFCKSLFQVILASLFLSWLLAITLTPFFCVKWLKVSKSSEKQNPYDSPFYNKYLHFLKKCLLQRWRVTGIVVLLLVIATIGFRFVDKSFFPDNPLPMFYIDSWRPQGSSIYATERESEKIYQYLEQKEEIESVTSFIGGGVARFMLTYTPEEQNDSYSYILIKVKNPESINSLMQDIEGYLNADFPDAEPKLKRFILGTASAGGNVEVEFRGEDPNVLRQLSQEVEKIMHADKRAKNIRNDWRQRVKVLRPKFAETQARRSGITRPDINDAIAMTFEGKSVGLYREENRFLPIITRPPDAERQEIDSIRDIYIWSTAAQQNIPMRQVVSDFETKWEDPFIRRYDRHRAIRAQADEAYGTAETLRQNLIPKVEDLEIPAGYTWHWEGEYKNSKDANEALTSKLPMTFLVMVLIIILLFNALRQPLIIYLCVPLAIFGVTVGLLVFNRSFGFMATLGFLSLAGMLIKNGVVLIDQIDLEIREGKPAFEAILDSSVSRVRPVTMAALTTILGMTPLLWDIFFVDMAVTIMVGLAFGTLLTLIVVPVFYAIFFKVRNPQES